LPQKVFLQLLFGFQQEWVREIPLRLLLGKFQFRKAFFSDAKLDIS
jgi:hypothetical protein